MVKSDKMMRRLNDFLRVEDANNRVTKKPFNQEELDFAFPLEFDKLDISDLIAQRDFMLEGIKKFRAQPTIMMSDEQINKALAEPRKYLEMINQTIGQIIGKNKPQPRPFYNNKELNNNKKQLGGILSSLGGIAGTALGGAGKMASSVLGSANFLPGLGAALQGFGAYRQAQNQQRALDSAIGSAREIPSMISDMYSPAMQRAREGMAMYDPYTGVMSRNLQRTIGSGLTQNIGATDPAMRKLFTRGALAQAQRAASDAIPMFAQQQQNMGNVLSGLELGQGQALIGARENLAELEAARKGIDPFGQALGSVGASILSGLFDKQKQAGGKAKPGSVADLKSVAKELQKASKMHLGQSKRVAKHASMMNEKGDGGYIRGPHHGAGGVDVGNNVEVQGGEFVVNATSYNKHKSLIDAINMDDNEVVMMNALFGDKHSGADIHMNLQKGGSTVNKAGNYTKPGMRKRIFNRIKAGGKGGNPGQWSARKAQMLAKAYKDAGGGYKQDGGYVAQSGMRAPQKSLKNWGDQDWDYISKGDEKKPKSERGRYLPKSVRASLTPAQKASENRKKRAASRAGRQNAKYSKDVANKVRNAQGGGMMGQGTLLNKIIKQTYGM